MSNIPYINDFESHTFSSESFSFIPSILFNKSLVHPQSIFFTKERTQFAVIKYTYTFLLYDLQICVSKVKIQNVIYDSSAH